MEQPLEEYKEPKEVKIEKAANGYVITTYTERGRSVEVAKSMKEANRISNRILGKGDKEGK